MAKAVVLPNSPTNIAPAGEALHTAISSLREKIDAAINTVFENIVAVKGPFSQGGSTVSFFKYEEIAEGYKISWQENNNGLALLPDHIMLRLQPYVQALRDCETHTFISVKGNVTAPTNLEVLYSLTTNMKAWPIKALEQTYGAVKKDIAASTGKAACNMLSKFLMKARYPTGGTAAMAFGKHMVFRVDTFRVENKIFLNEIEVWPPAMDYLDDIDAHHELRKELAKSAAKFVKDNLYSWPL